MKTSKIPSADSIQEFAAFWDNHDLTDFQRELKEVSEPVFVRSRSILLHLRPSETRAVRRLAETEGISESELVREWVLQKLGRKNGIRKGRR